MRFDILTSANKDALSNQSAFCQVWAVALTEVKQVGDMSLIGIAVNENLLMNLILPEDHCHLKAMKDMGKDLIGK